MVERARFAELLQRLRAASGLSQTGLADRSGVAASTIRQFEQGRREPTYATLVKLAHGLGVSLSAFDAPGAAAEAPPTKGRPRKAAPEPSGEKPAPKKTARGRKKG